ncbi:MAG: ABC transporter permease [bacterium]
MRNLRYVAVRVLLLIPQMLVLTALVFVLVRILPGDPVAAQLGGAAPEESLEKLRKRLGLDKPIHVQYFEYMKGLLLRGDLGDSWRTAQPVMQDLKKRFPATLELLGSGMAVAVGVGVSAGVITALRPGGLLDRAAVVYTLLAGAMPEFYIALVLIFVFYAVLRIAPHPVARLDVTVLPPPTVTGMYLVDSALAGQRETFRSALAHLVLPVATLSFWQAGAIMKMTRSTMLQILDGDFTNYARLMGVKTSILRRYALRNALPPIISLVVMLFGVLLGATVLIEQVFAWGGLGQYSVISVTSADYEAVVGFLMLTTTVSLVLYIFLDIAYVLIDPRLRL